MKLHNSYIFLESVKKEEKKEKVSENVIRIDIGSNVYSWLVKLFPDIVKQRNESDEWFYKHTLIWECSIDKVCCAVEFIVYEVIDVTYLDVVVEGKSRSQNIKCLECIHETLQNSGIRSDYIIITSYDAVSEYYCNKIYPKLNELERNLRRLLYNIYSVNFGRDLYRATISSDVQNKAKNLIRAKGKGKESINLQEFFYSLEFSDIQSILFTPNWTEYDIRKREKFLSEHEDLSKLTDQELREAFSNYLPKSDWERFFSEKISDIDVQSSIEEIRKFRNSVAHCKFFYKDSYSKCNVAVKQLNKAILGAIEETEEKDFAWKYHEALSNAINRMQDTLDQIRKTISESVAELSRAAVTVLEDRELFCVPFKAINTAASSAISSSFHPYNISEVIPKISGIQIPDLRTRSEAEMNADAIDDETLEDGSQNPKQNEQTEFDEQ